MTQKVHGYPTSTARPTGQMNFFLFRTSIDIRNTGVVVPLNATNYIDVVTLPVTIKGVNYTTPAQYNAALTAQKRFNLVVETLSLFCQPIILGDVFVTNETAGSTGIPYIDSLTGTFDIYNLRVMTEKNLALDLDEFEDRLAETGPNTNPALHFVKVTTPGQTNIVFAPLFGANVTTV
ncbi:MAG: hypothetical protein NZZ41_02085 [Candidatus Dojkabacteria bacterium]|nr:hypothetical protein [Candidatus Dojkabacteria bacterium]